MKMVKSLLLGTAAGFVAVAGAQAADMPVKAQPVQYVKICSLYGDGFYYIPGTDICLKIGGFIRIDVSEYGGANVTNGAFAGPGIGMQTRVNGQDFTYRTRAYSWFDSRQQTEYGTLRTFLNIGVIYDSPQGTTTNFNANRAFIQFAGFTIGTAQSFFDFYSLPASSYIGANLIVSDTGDGGWKVAAYTAQFGNGVSSTVSIEEPRQQSIWNTNTVVGGTVNTVVLGAVPPGDAVKQRFPDIVTNLRVDQPWGSAQVMAAAHDGSAGYYGATLTGSEVNGHPADKVGWAAGAGFKVNGVGGDYFQLQATYSQGALRYVMGSPAAFTTNLSQFTGNNLGYGILVDGVFNTATGDIQQTTVWGVVGAYDHFWRPDLRTSLYGSYMSVNYNGAANASICATQTAAPNAGSITFTAAQVAAGQCNNNWGLWGIGSRTQYNFTPWFYVGFDVFYSRLQTANAGQVVGFNALAGGAKPTGFYTVANQNNLHFRVRFQRELVP